MLGFSLEATQLQLPDLFQKYIELLDRWVLQHLVAVHQYGKLQLPVKLDLTRPRRRIKIAFELGPSVAISSETH